MTFHTSSIDHRNASQEELIDACKLGKYSIIGGCKYGNLVVRISENAVVKYGTGTKASEAAPQAYVHKHVDSSVFRVPKGYRFLDNETDWGLTGYLVMEFIEGTELDALDEQIRSGLSARLAGCLQHLWQMSMIEKEQSGPLGGGEPAGSIWWDEGACTVFGSVADVESWLNVSLKNDQALAKIGRWNFLDHRKPLEPLEPLEDGLSLAGCTLVICPGDIVGRNVILQESGVLYPVFFDLYSLIANEYRDRVLLSPPLTNFSDLRETYGRE